MPLLLGLFLLLLRISRSARRSFGWSLPTVAPREISLKRTSLLIHLALETSQVLGTRAHIFDEAPCQPFFKRAVY